MQAFGRGCVKGHADKPGQAPGNLLEPPALGLSGGFVWWASGTRLYTPGVYWLWRYCTLPKWRGKRSPLGFVLIGIVDPHENIAIGTFYMIILKNICLSILL